LPFSTRWLSRSSPARPRAPQAPATALVSSQCDLLGPWQVDTKAVTIRSKASAKITATGVLYASHEFTARKSSANWHYIADKNTGVKGCFCGSQANHEVRTCLQSALHSCEFAGGWHFLAVFASDQRGTRSCLAHAFPRKGAMSCPTTPTT
jgi:hypothetical protein